MLVPIDVVAKAQLEVRMEFLARTRLGGLIHEYVVAA